ncbi:MAG: hypothetical protein H7Z41_07845 [Cytophagales bacterium]|nr:hypothetical protein [Armatimonadota bacterium]
MTPDIQQALTFVIVLAAAASLGLRIWKHARGTSGGSCSGCGECGRDPNPNLRPALKPVPLVTLSSTAPPRRRAQPPPSP